MLTSGYTKRIKQINICKIVRTGSGPYNKCSVSITFKQEFPEVTLILFFPLLPE